jgi:hypothetical protein
MPCHREEKGVNLRQPLHIVHRATWTFGILLFAFATTVGESRASSDPMDSGGAWSSAMHSFDFFAGTWNCTNGSLTSTEVFTRDPDSGALVVHRKVTSPTPNVHGTYFTVPAQQDPQGAVQIWNYSVWTKQYTLAVQNAGSLRTFVSPGWADASITWSSAWSTLPHPLSQESLVYVKVSNTRYTVTRRQPMSDGQIVDRPSMQCDRAPT